MLRYRCRVCTTVSFLLLLQYFPEKLLICHCSHQKVYKMPYKKRLGRLPKYDQYKKKNLARDKVLKGTKKNINPDLLQSSSQTSISQKFMSPCSPQPELLKQTQPSVSQLKVQPSSLQPEIPQQIQPSVSEPEVQPSSLQPELLKQTQPSVSQLKVQPSSLQPEIPQQIQPSVSQLKVLHQPYIQPVINTHLHPYRSQVFSTINQPSLSSLSSFPTSHITTPVVSMDFRAMKTVLKTCCLPKGWIEFSEGPELKFMYMYSAPGDEPVILKSLVILSDGHWMARIHQRPIARSVFPGFPLRLCQASTVLRLIEYITTCMICPGNAEEKFINMSGVGDSHITLREGNIINTLRADDCTMITEVSKDRCISCRRLRKHLYIRLSRSAAKLPSEKQTDRCSVSSTVPLSSLTANELRTRTRNIIKAKRKSELREARLRNKLKDSIVNEGEVLDSETSTSLRTVIDDYHNVVENEHGEGTFERLFWEEQKKALLCNDKRGHRWHPMFIKWCLNLRLRSKAAYNTLRDSGVIQLPHNRTLMDYTHWTKETTGFNPSAFEQLERESNFVNLEDHQKYVVLLHDELRIHADLVYIKSTGQLVGFVNIGDFGDKMQKYARQQEDDSNKTRPEIARYILAFMVRGITLRLQYPLAHFPTNVITSDYLSCLVWEAIELLELTGFKVLASTSDGASPNRRFYRLHAVASSEEDVVYSTCNIFATTERDIYFFSDVPHLMKTVRNCWSNSECHSKKRTLWNGEPISWKTIVDLYKADVERGGLFLCNKLKHEHVYLNSFSRMKVKYAVQVLSSQVANAIETVHGDRKKATVEFVRKFDRFFDCMNVRSMKEGHKKRKPDLLPYTSPNDERLLWLEDDFLKYLEDWSKRVDERELFTKSDKNRMKLSRETLEGLKMSVNSFVHLARYLLRVPGVTCVLSEKLNQDPLESYFGNQRQMKGGNDAPSVYQFSQNANALRMKSSQQVRVKGANVATVNQTVVDNTPLPRRSYSRYRTGTN